ncbi:unnamed protein product [Darwinula stevensoni]|uniref:ascorbate ferrireductase (transmembrane) n=1 Tax=Darwinula stevensoni TaxID=69355 RepID=A0A7R8XBB4_9CRUS|nr:unnamed protein product [Darwinula stevensoni]CAG0892214.1 unnamed protein product [Darwinula stevensoni]
MAEWATHGALMIAAWLGFAATGVLLPTYFRGDFPGKKILNKDLWFAGHWLLMNLALLFTVISFIVIYNYEGWKQEKNNHSALGLFVCILAFVQPLAAAFRPGPTSEWRPAFNWIHWAVGNLILFLAYYNSFLGLGRVGSSQGIYLLGFFVVFNVFVHFAIQVLYFFLRIRKIVDGCFCPPMITLSGAIPINYSPDSPSQKLEKNLAAGEETDTNRVAPSATFNLSALKNQGGIGDLARKGLLVLHFIVAWGVVIALGIIITK